MLFSLLRRIGYYYFISVC